MDLQTLIDAYKAWVAATPNVYKVLQSTTVLGIAPTLEAVPGIIQPAFDSGVNAVSIAKMPNTATLDGFLSWYEHVHMA